MNLAQMIEHNARLYPDKPALSVGRSVYATFQELAARMRAISYHFRVIRKLPPGTRIGICMTNCPEFWEVLFGSWHAGLIAVPINPKLHGREIEFILAHSGASLCFVTPDMAPIVSPFIEELNSLHDVISSRDSHYRQITTAAVPNLDAADIAPSDPAWIFYTSGTTGRPKGAMLSHRNLMVMILAYCTDIDQPSPADCIVHGASQSHGSGLWGLVHFAKGANNIIPESGGFDPTEFAYLLNHYSGLSMFAAPTMINRMVTSSTFVAADLSHLKTISYGGAPLYLADILRALDVLGPCLTQIYGQGEAPMTITGLSKNAHSDVNHPRHLARMASVGVARSGVNIRIIGPDGRTLPFGEIGEVTVRGDVVMTHYWCDDIATSKALNNGWLHTGDIGSFDKDGFLTLLDRCKDMIISGGSNIYPREIEELLLIHPSVREVAVIGRPNPEWGEEVVAFVVPQCGSSQAGQETLEHDLDLLCLENIARYKRPRAYIFVESLPKNSTGKILRTELREKAELIGSACLERPTGGPPKSPPRPYPMSNPES